MFTNNLFERVLIEPASQYSKARLQIVSGFATASMAHRHLEELVKCNASASIEIIAGMTNLVGIEKAQHEALCELVRSQPYYDYGLDFRCRYVAEGNPIHAKSYLWLDATVPLLAFCGSPNYTITGFVRQQIEAVAKTDPASAAGFYERCLPNTIDCLDESVNDYVNLTESKRMHDYSTEDSVTLTLLDSRTGETHQRAGLNWGQRPGRDRNQAYIPIPVQHRDFFPEIAEQFTVLTDENIPLVFVRAQQEGKALHTTQNNALLGEYFRKRLGLSSGEYVTKQHLLDYGRTDVTFVKIDEETYLMDFRPNTVTEHHIEGAAN